MARPQNLAFELAHEIAEDPRRTGPRHRFQCRDLWSQKCDTEASTKIPRLPVKRQYSLPDNLVTFVNFADWKFPYKYSDLLRTMSVTISTESEMGSYKKVDGVITSGEGRVDNFGTMKNSNMRSLKIPERNTYLSAKTMWIILELEDLEHDVEICIAIFRSSSLLEYSGPFYRVHISRGNDSFPGWICSFHSLLIRRLYPRGVRIPMWYPPIHQITLQPLAIDVPLVEWNRFELFTRLGALSKMNKESVLNFPSSDDVMQMSELKKTRLLLTIQRPILTT